MLGTAQGTGVGAATSFAADAEEVGKLDIEIQTPHQTPDNR